VTPEAVDSAFRRAIALDSTFAPAYLHLVEDAFQRTDSAESGTLIRALMRFDSTSPKTTGLEIAWALAFGKTAQRDSARARLPSLGSDALLPAKHAVNLNPDLAQWTELLGRAIGTNTKNPLSDRGQGFGGAGESYELRGRFRDSWALILRADALFDSSGSSPYPVWSDLAPAVYRLEGVPAYAAWEARPNPERTGGFDPLHQGDPTGAYFLGMWGLERGEWEVVSRSIAALRQMTDTLVGGVSLADSLNRVEDRFWIQRLARQLESWAEWTRHPGEARLRQFEAATDSLRDYDVMVVIGDFVLGKAFLAAGDLASAERHMRAPQRWNSGFVVEVIPPREYYLGRIAEERGDRAEAREHYTRFVRWWRDCDPELKPMWEDGRQRLAKVSGEPREP
jgi:tetratricopeptide (TPR) repeat protein